MTIYISTSLLRLKVYVIMDKLNQQKYQGRKHELNMLASFLSQYLSNYQLVIAGVLVAWVLTLIMLKCNFKFLPHDQGREFAINGDLSKGKVRGVGLIMVICFLIATLLFVPVTKEYIIYAILLVAMMLSGYLDDASDTPWSEWKKGLIDLVVSVVTVLTFMNHNSLEVHFFGLDFQMPFVVYLILGIVLIWVSINVTNCSDGVDGLCATLCMVTIGSFACIFFDQLGDYANYGFIFIGVLLAYLYFNSSPSSVLMGDAGSRALGFFIAILAMKSGHPFSFIALALVMIIDGGFGLVKVSLLRYLKIRILKNTRTPIHDNQRKNKGWSDTQTVFRFAMIQVIISILFFVFC